MAIQNRRGSYSDFDPSQLLVGEWAFVTNGDPNGVGGVSVYACFGSGDVRRMSTYDEIVSNIESATAEVRQALIASINTSVVTQEIIRNMMVTSFNGRTGAIIPTDNDYSANMIKRQDGSETVEQSLAKRPQMVLLWTNLNPKTSVSTLDVTIDTLSNYDAIKVVSHVTNSLAMTETSEGLIDKQFQLDYSQALDSDNAARVSSRSVKFSGNVITFGKCIDTIIAKTGACAVTTDATTRMIPYQIYGIKY